MKCLIMLASALVLTLSAPSIAASCMAISPTTVASELNAEHVPARLLKKAHVYKLSAYDPIYRCKGDRSKFEKQVLKLEGPPLDRNGHLEYVTITFFEFPSVESRDRRVHLNDWPDNDAANDPDIDVFYYLVPDSTKAVRVERLLGYMYEY